MNIPHLKRMTAEEFVTWAMNQERGRYELIDGMVVQMNPERLVHARVKLELAIALQTSFDRAGLEGDVLGDGMAVRINETTVHEPDALVRCGAPLPGETTLITDPIIVCEVLSPSTGPVDTGLKLLNYFTVPSVQHYLVVNTSKRVVLHYARGDDGKPTLHSVSEGELRLDPPGLTIALADLFENSV
jgi:Uma2 family endonuclease